MEHPNQTEHSQQQAQKIVDSLKGLQYGTIVVVVHDGKVVQIERTEKIRFEARRKL